VAGDFVDTRHVNQRTADKVPGEKQICNLWSEHGMSVSDTKGLQHSRDGRKTTKPSKGAEPRAPRVDRDLDETKLYFREDWGE
jgi:hypothetical protein